MMPPDPRQIEEWLSGLLDGELSEQEQRDLDSAMRNDPSIAERLEEMTNLRRALLQGRSVGRLGSDFSTKIVQAARNRASEMDAPPAWVLPDAPNAVAPRTQDTLWQEDELPSERSAPLSVELVASDGSTTPRINGI
ncbi:MAG: anti-sigma factor family protein, partial [Pirellula sp.]